MTLEQRLEALAPVLEEYVLYTKQVPKAFAQDKSTSNTQAREAIIGLHGDPMYSEAPILVEKQLEVMQKNIVQKLEGRIDAANPLHELAPAQLPDQKPLMDKSFYTEFMNERPLSDHGKHMFYDSLLQNPVIAKEAHDTLKRTGSDKYKGYKKEMDFARSLIGDLQQGNVAAAVDKIRAEKNGAEIASLARLYQIHGAPGTVDTVVQHVAQAAQIRAEKMYNDVKGELQKAVDGAIEKSGTSGYMEAFLTRNAVYESDPEKVYRTDAAEAKKAGVTDLNKYREMKAKKAAAAKAGKTA